MFAAFTTLEHRQKNSYAMHTIKITPNLLFEYQCISGKFIRLPDRIEKIDSAARIESNQMETFLCPNWNALATTTSIVLMLVQSVLFFVLRVAQVFSSCSHAQHIYY